MSHHNFKFLFAAAALAIGSIGCVGGEEETGAEVVEEASEPVLGGKEIATRFVDAGTPNNPKTDPTILRHLLRMIQNEKKAIRISIFLIDNEWGMKIARALVKAKKKRHVDVQVVMDGLFRPGDDDADPSPQLPKIMKRLRALGDKSFVSCEGGCAGSGRMHAKFATFRKTKDEKGKARSFVTWIGSANLKTGSGMAMYNNSITVQDKKLFHGMNRYFDAIAENEQYPGNDFYAPAAGRGYAESSDGRIRVHASPNKDGTDLLAERLHNIHPTKGCELHIVAAQINDNRREVFDELETIAKTCDVWITVNPGKLERGPINRLLASQKQAGKHNVHVKTLVRTHDKIITYKGKYNCGSDAECKDAPVRRIVMTGSHNITGSSNNANDELLVVASDKSLHSRYVKWAKHQYKMGTAF
jgi:hypothetical protein